MKRMVLHVTEQERELLKGIADALEVETPRELLESFIADLTNSGRRKWPCGEQNAADWLLAHHQGLAIEAELEASSLGSSATPSPGNGGGQ